MASPKSDFAKNMRVILNRMQRVDEVRTLWKMTADIESVKLTDEEVMETRRVLLLTEDEYKKEVQVSLMRQGHIVIRQDEKDVHFYDVGHKHCKHTIDSSRRRFMSKCAWVGEAQNILNDDKKVVGFYVAAPDSKRVDVYAHKCPSFGEPDGVTEDCTPFNVTAVIGGRGGDMWDGM
jgi:hypothetical protein